MNLEFVADANLSLKLAIWLNEQGYKATHVHSLGLDGSSDSGIWEFARSNNAIIVSKDQDFFNRLVLNIPPRLVWVKWGNVSRKTLFQKIEAALPEIVAALESGEWLVELRDKDIAS